MNMQIITIRLLWTAGLQNTAVKAVVFYFIWGLLTFFPQIVRITSLSLCKM